MSKKGIYFVGVWVEFPEREWEFISEGMGPPQDVAEEASGKYKTFNYSDDSECLIEVISNHSSCLSKTNKNMSRLENWCIADDIVIFRDIKDLDVVLKIGNTYQDMMWKMGSVEELREYTERSNKEFPDVEGYHYKSFQEGLDLHRIDAKKKKIIFDSMDIDL